MHRDEPIEQWQFRAMHHSATREGGAMPTARALPLASVPLPIMVGASTLGADDAIALAQRLQMLLASLLVGEMSVELYQIHGLFDFLISKVTTKKWNTEE